MQIKKSRNSYSLTVFHFGTGVAVGTCDARLGWRENNLNGEVCVWLARSLVSLQMGTVLFSW